MTTEWDAARGIPPVRRWSRREVLLAAALLSLAASAWLLAHAMGTPDMRLGILTGAQPMGDMRLAGPSGAVLFLLTWMVMMAAMMLPSVVPFTIGVGRLMRSGGSGRSGTALLTLGYFAVWAATGVLAYLVWRAFHVLSFESSATAVRAGSVVLLGAAVYQLSPLKRVCLRNCRSPTLLLLQHGPRAVASRFGAIRAGVAHGSYCLGCCWALMTLLLALGVMSLVWMGVVAAVIAMEKVSRYGETISRGLGIVLAAMGMLIHLDPALLSTIA